VAKIANQFLECFKKVELSLKHDLYGTTDTP
jgi:hypothetical protein